MQGEFFNRFHRGLRLIRNPGVQGAGGVLAFEDNAERIAGRAVDANVIPAVDAGAGRQLDEAERVTDGARAQGEVQRQGVDAVAGNGGALLGTFGFEQGSRGCDTNRFGGGAHLQHDVEPDGLGHLNPEAGLLRFAEPRMLDRQVVSADGHGRNRVVPRTGGCRAELEARLRIDGDHRGGRHQGPGGIAHRAGDGATITLPVESSGQGNGGKQA